MLLENRAKSVGVEAISTMRKMRGAAVAAETQENSAERMLEILTDAEVAGTLAASTIIDLVTDKNLSLERWSDQLKEYQLKYRGFYPVTIGMKDLEAIGNLLEAFCRRLADGAKDAFENHLLKENGLKYLTTSFFLNDRLGVLAPLSSDYLFAAICRDHLKRSLSSECFVVKPVIMGRRRQALAMPTDTEGRPFFADYEEVVGLVDMNGTGNTRIALKGIAAAHYPNLFKNRCKRTPMF